MTATTAPPAHATYDDQLATRLLHHRVVLVSDELDAAGAARVCAQLLLLAAEDGSAPVGLYLTGPGGSLAAARTVADTLHLVPTPVTTLALGPLTGALVLLLASGSEGRRLAVPHATLTLRVAGGGGLGLGATREVSARREETMAELLATRTGRPVPTETSWLAPEQAVEHGLLDRVVTGVDDVTPGRIGRGEG